MAQKPRPDGDVTLNVIEQSNGQSWIDSNHMRRALTGQSNPAPSAHMILLTKNMQ
jgi:3-hydroxyisobutyrate dehydrogenase-like beta-hydroxyacid dehydrogenase